MSDFVGISPTYYDASMRAFAATSKARYGFDIVFFESPVTGAVLFVLHRPEATSDEIESLMREIHHAHFKSYLLATPVAGVAQ